MIRHTAPCGDQVHVWHARSPLASCDERDLSAPERTRAGRLLVDSVRARFVTGRTVLRTILSSYLNCAPAEVRLIVDTHGKPRLAPPGSIEGASALCFNLSHSGDRLVVAVAARAVGIDVERIDPRIGADAIASRCFAADEVASLAAISILDRLHAFVGLWARKESVLKALGVGLTTPLRDFSVAVPPAPPRILTARDPRLSPDQWTLADLPGDDGFAGCVTLGGSTLALVHRVWPSELATPPGPAMIAATRSA